jgi:hypothetical protein
VLLVQTVLLVLRDHKVRLAQELLVQPELTVQLELLAHKDNKVLRVLQEQAAQLVLQVYMLPAQP